MTITVADPKTIALQFNDYINERDINALALLMTDDHTFIDTGNNHNKGKQNSLIA